MKEKDIACRFNAPLAVPHETRIVRSDEKVNETIVKQSKKRIEKVLSYIIIIVDLSDVTLSEIWSYSITACIRMCGKEDLYIMKTKNI